MNDLNAKGHLLAALSLLAIMAGKTLAGPGAGDQTYAPVVSSGAVYAMGLQTDGKLVVGGAFTAVNSSSSRYHLARLLSDGTLDSTFFATGSGVYSTVWALAIQSDGRIVIGGDFTSVGGTSRYHVARLNSNGTVDGSFIPTNAINYSVLAVAVQTNNGDHRRHFQSGHLSQLECPVERRWHHGHLVQFVSQWGGQCDCDSNGRENCDWRQLHHR
jgi:uncharacterized delta-60 repeat protein